MDRVNHISRRSVVTCGLVSAGLSLLPTERVSARSAPLAQAGASENDELYEGKNLPGGGQIDPRLSVSPYANDEDIVEVAERMSPFNPESWHVEWKRVAEKNERLAEEFEKEGLKVTANGFYLPAFNKLIDMYKRAWQLVPPPFDRVEIPYEGTTLPGYFAKPRGNPGQRFPTVYAFGGADSTLIGGGGGAYTARGMAYLFVDGPGQGIPLRLKQVSAPPDSERVAKAVFDYLVTRPDSKHGRLYGSAVCFG